MSESDREHAARSVALEQAYVHEVYEQCAEKTTQSKHWPRVYQFLQELEPGALVCDIGCGNGKYLSVNHSVFKVGIDRCKRFTDIAREKENEVLICDNLALPFREESFDAVLSIAVVHHFATTERRVHALRELARILRIGGRLVISVWAMEQKHRKFESQDVLVPWPKSYCMNETSDKTKDLNVFNGNEKRDDNTANKYSSFKRNNQRKSKNYWIDPIFSLSPSTSSLSSPNETCYSCFRRALQKLARGRCGRGGRTWFSGSWQSSTRNQRHNDSEDMTDVDELPIELRRVEATHTLITNKSMDTLSIKSKSLGDILEIERLDLVRSISSIPGLCSTPEIILDERSVSSSLSGSKPRLVKQKSCVEEIGFENPEDTAIENLIKDLSDFPCQSHKYNVPKQSSMNEELMSAERLAEKEQLHHNIMKQASLNEELICKWRTFEALKDAISPVNASKRFRLLKDGLTNTIKRSTTNIEKVSSMSIKNGFARMLQGWKFGENKSAEATTKPKAADKVQPVTVMKRSIEGVERRLSREDGSDSSKDSSLQSDTSVDSEDSFASVIFVPKQDAQVPTTETSPRPAALTLGTTSAPPSPRIKQPPELSSSRFKLISMSPLLKQQSADALHFGTVVKHAPIVVCKEKPNILQTTSPELRLTSESAKVDAPDTAPLIRAFNDVTKVVREPITEDENRMARLNQIKELLIQKPGFATRTKSSFPIVRRSSMATSRRLETATKILPRLLSLELFNPETDDLDSDSSGVSSPESIGSVISVMSDERYFAKKDVEQKKDNVQTDKIALKTEEKDIIVSDVIELTDTQYDESLILKSAAEVEDSKTVLSHVNDDSSTISEDKTICDILPKSEALIILDSQDDLKTGTISPILVESGKSASLQSIKLLEAAASVANSLEDAVETAIQRDIQVESQLLQTAQQHYRDCLLTQSNVQIPAYLKEKNKSAALDLSGYGDESNNDIIQDINKYSQNSSFGFVKTCETSKVTSKPTDSISVGSTGMCWEECNGVSKNISGIVNEANNKNDTFVNIIHSKLESQSETETGFNFQYKSKPSCEDQFAFEPDIKSKYEIKIETEPETTLHSKYDKMLKFNFESKDMSDTESRLESKFNSKYNISVTSDLKESINEDKCNFNHVTIFQSETETKLQTKLEPESEPILIKSNIDQKPDYSSTMSLLRGNSDETCDFVMVSKTDGFECDTKHPEKWRSQGRLSMESSDVGDSIENTTSLSDGSQVESRLFTSSTMSLVSGTENQQCSIERRRLHERGRSLDEISSKTKRNARNGLVASTNSLSNASSQESLPSDRGGGAITYHQYYHVFREGELDQLINKYVENLHIISSYYDHASWCVVAEKVQVWTI